ITGSSVTDPGLWSRGEIISLAPSHRRRRACRLQKSADMLPPSSFFMTFYMKTMIPLRIVGICSNCAFIMYGYLDGLYPVLILHLILLPLNSLRLREMLKLVKQVREATGGDPNMDWLKPFTSTRHVQPGEKVFHKGEPGRDMFVVMSGHFWLVETGIE